LAGDSPVDREVATLVVVRARMEVAGPVTVSGLCLALALSTDEVTLALHHLESEGQVLRGTFRPGSEELEWCDRRLLQRIHRLTVGRLRREIEPLSAQDFMRFLFRWHHLEPSDALGGQGGLLRAVSLLEGWEAPAASWEQVLLPARVRGNVPELLERACWTGDVAWGRLSLREPRVVGPRRGGAVGRLGRLARGPYRTESCRGRRACAARSVLLRGAGVRLRPVDRGDRGRSLGSSRPRPRHRGRGGQPSRVAQPKAPEATAGPQAWRSGAMVAAAFRAAHQRARASRVYGPAAPRAVGHRLPGPRRARAPCPALARACPALSTPRGKGRGPRWAIPGRRGWRAVRGS